MQDDDITVSCACGFTVHGAKDDVIDQTKQHGRDVHNMDVTDEEVLAMARPTTD